MINQKCVVYFTSLLRSAAGDNRLQDSLLSDCPAENNPCDQVCYLIGVDTTICDCHPGHALLPDGESCRGDPHQHDLPGALCMNRDNVRSL